jgi:hypothetical protein
LVPIGQFAERLQFGIQRELIDLCRLTSLNGQRARLFFNTGIESVAQLANSSSADIENLLQNCAPFESAKVVDGENAREVLARQTIRSFWVTGQKGLTEAEAAKLIVDEAREILKKDLGVEVVKWDEIKPPSEPAVAGKNRRSSTSSSINATRTTRRSSSVSPSAHMSFLGGRLLQKKSLPVKKRTKSTSKPKVATAQKAVSSSILKSNLSFDMSAQIEQLFEDDELIDDSTTTTTTTTKWLLILDTPEHVDLENIKLKIGCWSFL